MTTSSLLRRILPALALTVCGLTVVIVAIGVVAMQRAVLDRARLRAWQLSLGEHENLERLMRCGDHGDLQLWINRLGSHPDVAAARLVGTTGIIDKSSLPAEVGHRAGVHAVQSSARGDLTSAAVLEPDGPLAIHVVHPFLNGPECHRCHSGSGKVIGQLDLDVRVYPHVTGLVTFGTLSGLLGLLYIAAVVGVAAPLVTKVVGGPVRRLLTAMQDVKAGNLAVHVLPSGTTEVDGLIDGFNQMVVRLRQGQDASEEARRLHLERVEQLAAVGELAAGLAHEIRNPLYGAKAVLEVFAEEQGGDAVRRAALRDAAGELVRVDRILRELLQYARPRVSSAVPFDLGALAREAATLTLASATAKGATLTLKLLEGLPAVLGDIQMTRQVIVNLLLNAEQAAPSIESLRVTIETGTDGETAWCRVRDFGPGVPSDKAETIFRPFMTTKTRGTGLGLSISRRLVEMQGGRLVLENPGEPGASFCFRLGTAPAGAGQGTA